MTATVLIERRREPRDEHEPVTVEVDAQRVDEAIAKVTSTCYLVSETEIDVLGQPGVVVEADLERHAALQHPPPGLGGHETGDDSLEEDSPPKSIEADTGLD